MIAQCQSLSGIDGECSEGATKRVHLLDGGKSHDYNANKVIIVCMSRQQRDDTPVRSHIYQQFPPPLLLPTSRSTGNAALLPLRVAAFQPFENILVYVFLMGLWFSSSCV